MGQSDEVCALPRAPRGWVGEEKGTEGSERKDSAGTDP